MAKILQQLLNAEEPLFSHSLKELEKAAGHKGVDVRLIADITHRVHTAMREMSLEPQFTNGQEFYRALLARVAQDNKRIVKAIGDEDPDDVRATTPMILQAASKTLANKKCWVLKPVKARELLRKDPPQKLLDHFKASSVEQLLDKKPLNEIYIALRFSEGDAWLRRHNEQLARTAADDFEPRNIEFIQLDESYLPLTGNYLAKRPHGVAHSKELGIVAILPMEKEFVRGITLLNLSFALHYCNEIRMYSAYFQLKQARPDFGKLVVYALNNDLHEIGNIAKHGVHWRSVQRYFGAVDDARHPEVFRPHIHPEDLHWKTVEAQLTAIEPSMQFWQGLEYVGLYFDGAPVSANILDVSTAYAQNIPYEKRPADHLRESLWNEIAIRYIGENNLEHQVLAHFGDASINLS